MKESKFALGKTNFVLMAVAVLIIIIGFVLMGGEGSTAEHFNPEIFSPMRIKVAPIVCVLGFFGVGFAIMYRGKRATSTQAPTADTNTDSVNE